MSEKRRAGVLVSGSSSSSGCEADQEFVSRSGVSALLAGALLRLLDCRSGDPLGFLAEHFAHLSAEAEEGGAEQRSLSRALWMLSLQHHSQRSAFNSSVRVSYDLLSQCGAGVGGVGGRLYTETLQSLCSEGGLSASTSAPLLRRLQCREHETVPFELYRQAVLTCSVFADYIRKSQCLYAAVASAPDRPAQRTLCCAVLETLKEALKTADGPDTARYLEASAKISPAKVAQAMAEAHSQTRDGETMDAQEFEDAAAALFIARVRTVT